MSHYDGVEPDVFQIVWKSGAVDLVKAHQVSHPNNAARWFGNGGSTEPIVMFHAEIDGYWRLMLRANENDMISIRNMTQVGDAV